MYISNPGSKSIIHVLLFSTSDNLVTLGSRIPAVWTHATLGDTNSRSLHISSGVNTNANDYKDSKRVEKNQWHLITVEQKLVDSKYIYSVHVNGELLYTTENTNPKTYKNVKVYVSDPWYASLDGQIKDLKVKSSKGENILSLFFILERQFSIDLKNSNYSKLLPIEAELMYNLKDHY